MTDLHDTIARPPPAKDFPFALNPPEPGATGPQPHAMELEAAPLVRPSRRAADRQLPADDSGAPADLLTPLEIEAMALNLEASLRVHGDHQFFTWTQGLLQNIIRHEELICAMYKVDAGCSIVDRYSTSGVEPAQLGNLFRLDTALAPYLVKQWEEHHFQPVIVDVAGPNAYPGSGLAREFRRVGATALIAHGTADTSGKLASFFVFACRPGDAGRHQAHLVELLVPFLHTAWMRTKIEPVGEGAGGGTRRGGRMLLTAREQEILRWIYLGKSNIEIGMILGISSLTVKNHVQKILRRLDVQNRAQAVGKALALRILSS